MTDFVTDGGVFDNTGLWHALYSRKTVESEKDNIIFVSDAGASVDQSTLAHNNPVSRTTRVIDVLMERVAGLESTNQSDVLTVRIASQHADSVLDQAYQRRLAAIRTDLDRFSAEESSGLVQHGYESALSILKVRSSDEATSAQGSARRLAERLDGGEKHRLALFSPRAGPTWLLIPALLCWGMPLALIGDSPLRPSPTHLFPGLRLGMAQQQVLQMARPEYSNEPSFLEWSKLQKAPDFADRDVRYFQFPVAHSAFAPMAAALAKICPAVPEVHAYVAYYFEQNWLGRSHLVCAQLVVNPIQCDTTKLYANAADSFAWSRKPEQDRRVFSIDGNEEITIRAEVAPQWGGALFKLRLASPAWTM